MTTTPQNLTSETPLAPWPRPVAARGFLLADGTITAAALYSGWARFIRAAATGAAAWAATAGALRASTTYVPNGSFESPATAFVETQVDSWQKTAKPFWYDESSGYLWSQLTGVFANSAATSADHIDNMDGNQGLFLFAVPQVGLFQDYASIGGSNSVPDHAFSARFEPGKSYDLTVGVIGGGPA